MSTTGYCAICGAPTKNTVALPPPEHLPEVTRPGREYRCELHFAEPVDDAWHDPRSAPPASPPMEGPSQ